MSVVEKCWKAEYLVDEKLALVPALGSNYASPRFANDRKSVGGVDGESRLAGELRLPFGFGWWHFEHVGAGRLISPKFPLVSRRVGL